MALSQRRNNTSFLAKLVLTAIAISSRVDGSANFSKNCNSSSSSPVDISSSDTDPMKFAVPAFVTRHSKEGSLNEMKTIEVSTRCKKQKITTTKKNTSTGKRKLNPSKIMRQSVKPIKKSTVGLFYGMPTEAFPPRRPSSSEQIFEELKEMKEEMNLLRKDICALKQHMN